MSASSLRYLRYFLAAFILAAGDAAAAVRVYPSDATTLHLWHLDETATPAADLGSSSLPLAALGGGATLGNAAFTGFGTSLSTLDGGANVAAGTGTDAYLAAKTLVNGVGDNVTTDLGDATTGAFTFEALVRIDFNPTVSQPTRNLPMQIISGDQDSTGGGVRVFQFRFDPVGMNPNADGFTSALTAPALEFISVRNGTGVENKIVLLPVTGANAIAQGAWYHVAVTYSGAEGVADNLTFYWTKVDATRTQAAVLGTKTLTNDLSVGATDFAIGNIGRDPSRNNFVGLIDEVRVSGAARAATDFIFFTDTDKDGMDDAWETFYFGSLAQPPDGPDGDFDGDGFSNLAEYLAGSRPNNAASTPNDTDADGLPDAWERQYFGNLAQTGSGDPDGDTFTNAQEFAAGTQPNNAASRPDDTDGDGLPDPWEIAFFGNLAQTAAGDADGDGASNLAEYQAGSLPTNAASVPLGALAKFVPVDDGNATTSEFGYGGASNINTTAFICSALQTVGDWQFMVYYGRHETDAAYAYNNTIWIGRRAVGSAHWDVFRTTFTANDITDGHDVISFGIDGDGYMHLSWGMHGDPFHYARTTTPVTGGQNIVFGANQTMTGNESVVTYPQFLTLPNGDMLYLFREGASGAGDTYLNRYNRTTQTWTNVHKSGTAQAPFIKGRGWSPDYNAYPNLPCMDAAGNFTLTWTWRYNSSSPAGESGYQTNHDFDYAKSFDGGVTWKRQDASTYTLPISQFAESGVENTRAEKVLSIPEGSSLINQAGMCLDQTGQPVIASWWAPGTASGDYRRQYMVGFPTATGWQTRQVSHRTIDAVATKFSETYVRDLGRPAVVTDAEDRIIVIWRDNDGGNGLTIAHSLPRALDPNRTVWTQLELTGDNLGDFEPVIDLARWQRDHTLHVIYQQSAGYGYTPPTNTASVIGVLEWDATAYFHPRPMLNAAFVNSHADAALSFASQPGWGYRIWTSPDLVNWTALTTLAGTGELLNYTHAGGGGGTKRFWRLEIQEGGFAP